MFFYYSLTFCVSTYAILDVTYNLKMNVNHNKELPVVAKEVVNYTHTHRIKPPPYFPINLYYQRFEGKNLTLPLTEGKIKIIS